MLNFLYSTHYMVCNLQKVDKNKHNLTISLITVQKTYWQLADYKKH